jgi:hypothetical protein
MSRGKSRHCRKAAISSSARNSSISNNEVSSPLTRPHGLGAVCSSAKPDTFLVVQ